jgi:hypothetical protein
MRSNHVVDYGPLSVQTCVKPDGGQYTSVSFCGDMEICGVKVLLRNIKTVRHVDRLSPNEIVGLMKSSASSIGEQYYVVDVDSQRNSVVGFTTASKDFYQEGVAPHLILPVCASKIDVKMPACSIQTEISATLVRDGDSFGKPRFSAVKYNESRTLSIIERPVICESLPNSKECAP